MVGPVESLVNGGALDVHGRTLRVASARQVEGDAQVGVALAKIASLSESPGMPRWTCVPEASLVVDSIWLLLNASPDRQKR